MENNGKGLFYGVIGVATLIVAIIGATFAYFTATQTSTDNIVGTASTVGLSLEIQRVNLDGEGSTGLIPMDIIEGAVDLSTALTGTGGTPCKDVQGYTVCHIYRVIVTNSGNAVVKVNGTMTLDVTTLTNANANTLTLDGTTYTVTDDDVVGFDRQGTAINLTTNTSTVPGQAGDDIIGNNGTKDYYFVVWLEDTGTDQPDEQGQSYTGSVTFNGAGGSRVTATFS